MANNLTVTYKGNTIHTASASGSATLETGGTWCEGDIELDYTFEGSGSVAVVAVTVTNGTATSVTATKDGTTVSLTSSSGVWVANLPSFGTWTLYATDGTRSQTDVVNASVAGLYEITLRLQDIPNAYTQLEWVEASDTSETGVRLYTGLYPIYTNRVKGAFQYPYGADISANTQTTWIVAETEGCYWYLRLRYNNGSPHVRYRFNTENSGSINITPTTSKITFNLRGKSLNYNGTSYTATGNNITSNTAWQMQMWFTGSFAESNVVARWYYLQMYDTTDTNIIANFVPAKRNSDDIVGMYDTVRNVFVSPPRGTLTAGPAV